MWTNLVVCFVGFDGDATLNIINGGNVSNTSLTSIGENMGTGTVTADGVGSTWNEDAAIVIGVSGAGTLTISNGGHVSVSGAQSAQIRTVTVSRM
jgi:T5SS/PEP-CTERM-associated repeat protein